MIQSALDFVRSLQEQKKAQGVWAEKSVVERQQVLSQCLMAMRAQAESLATEIAKAEFLSKPFVQETVINPSLRHLETLSHRDFPENRNNIPVGLMALVAPDYLSFRWLTENISAALLSGNAVYVQMNEMNQASAHCLQPLLSKAPIQWVFAPGKEGEELENILSSHPGIRAVAFSGTPSRAEKVLRAGVSSWKKMKIESGFHNSALVLGDADLRGATKALVRSCFTGMGQLPWNITNILVLESQLPDFERFFLEELSNQGMNGENALFSMTGQNDFERMQKISEQIRSENGKILWQGQFPELKVQPLVVRDLSHCSTLQQDCLRAPVVLISPVKYAHEMVKWCNTSYYGQAAQIFGTVEKAEKIAAKLEVGHVFINQWIESLQALDFGQKQSSYGILDSQAFGAFYSEHRKIDIQESIS
ncbi:MAG: hypothetical protein COT73_00025 [Bdellovibrio sp. CG10_big_fil_rev_8_21_14_0_10_47_8]|nr:MAG: hypothetical protein COT73_00025 [Bdellovibrio sp. CG10_big_fil_rev_8_21_14_0_10_47_8]